MRPTFREASPEPWATFSYSLQLRSLRDYVLTRACCQATGSNTKAHTPTFADGLKSAIARVVAMAMAEAVTELKKATQRGSSDKREYALESAMGSKWA